MKQYVWAFMAVFFLLMGCDNYLDLKSNASFVVPSNLTDIQGLLDDAQRMNTNAHPVAAISLSDDYYLTDSEFDAIYDDLGRDIYRWQLIEYRTASHWGPVYSIVYNANLALELLDKVERTETNGSEWDTAKGSALFFRAFQFLALVSLHAHAFDEERADRDLGIPLRMASDFNVPSVRVSVRECYSRILDDFQKASILLPVTRAHVMQPSKAAAYAMLARTALYMRHYEDALKYADHALSIQDNLMDFNGDPDILGINANFPFRKFNKETLFYVESAGSWLAHSANRRIDSALIDSYADGDLRIGMFFKKDGENHYFKGGYTGSNLYFCGITTPELFLTRAEAKAFLGDISGAMNDLNKLLYTRWNRAVSFLPLNAFTREDALDLVRLERRKELLIRESRWMDIKRYNKEGANIELTRNIKGATYKLLPNDRYFAFPLPQDIIELSGMPQN